MAGGPVSVCPVAATLGEGPVWIGRALWFVDIKQHKVHRFDPETAELTSWKAPGQVGWVLPAANGGLLAGVQDGLHWLSADTGGFDLHAEVEADLPGNRLNDACTDPEGRIWFGSMDDTEEGATGRFYRYDRGQVTDAGLPPVSITNGPAVSPDGRLLYFTDTLGGLISVADVDADGALWAPRPFAWIDPADGYPDGPTVDAEGCVWTGLYGGWQARRYSPAGELLQTVRFPVANITKLAFGGDDLATVYATTARKGLGDGDLTHQPQAGNVFAFRAEVPGVPVTPARL